MRVLRRTIFEYKIANFVGRFSDKKYVKYLQTSDLNSLIYQRCIIEI